MRNLSQEEGFVHLLPILIVGLGSFLIAASIIPVNRNYNDGKSAVAGVYLAKGGDDSGSSDSSGSSGSTAQSTPQPIKVETELRTSANKEVKNEVENKKIETKEITKNSKVETKTTPEKIKSEIRQGNLRIKFEIENGKIKIVTKVKQGENETELESEAENEAVKEVEKELEKEDVKIATASGQVALVNKRVGALSSFPISVDPTTRQLSVTTPLGTKVVAVLPQKAIDNMLASHVMDDVTGEKVNNDLASIPDLVNLETKNGVLVYKVKGIKTHKLLGLIPIKTGVEAFVSAENGQVVESTDSLLGRILNRLAP